MDKLKEKLKNIAFGNKMDLFGVAPVERYADAPELVHPNSHLPEARSVIAMAIRYPDAMFLNAGDGDAESIFSIEQYQNTCIGKLLYNAALRISRALEDEGFKTIPISVSGRWRVHPYKNLPTNWCADFSNRHAAVAAGLGEFGLHSLCITPQFGMRQRFISVITEAELEPDPMYSGPALCDKCMLCVKSCPVNAISKIETETVKIGGRIFEYMKVDHWRCAWSEQVNMIPEEGPAFAGQFIGIMPPADAEITDEIFLDAFHKKNSLASLQASMTHAMGNCMRMCIPPHLRGKQKYPKNWCLKMTKMRAHQQILDPKNAVEYQLTN